MERQSLQSARRAGLWFIADPDRPNRTIVPRTLQAKLVHWKHYSMCHMGYKKVYHELAKRFWWRGMHKMCKEICQACELCALLKAKMNLAHKHFSAKLFCTPRGLRAVRYGANLVDSIYGGRSYTTRLEKYASRGFAIATPGYSPDLVRADLLGDRYAYFIHSGLLLRMGRCIWDRVSATCVPNLMESFKIMPETMRTGVAVRNLAKLIVLDRGNVVRHDNDIMRANARVCVPYRTDASTSRGEYVVVEGRALEDKMTVGDKENDLYVSMIGELVELILGKIRNAAEEDTWRTGGSVRAKNACQGILCVYDLVKCNSSFENLRFVLDARYDAGGVSLETFERRNHFPALLIFSEIGPRHKIENFTADVYR